MNPLLRASLPSIALLALALSGCASTPCADLCDRTVACSTEGGCTLKDEAATHDACVSACADAVSPMTAAGRDAFEACLHCAGTTRAACGDDASECQSLCTTTSVLGSSEALAKKLAALASDDAFACTNGDSPLSGLSCDGGGSSDGTTDTCETHCASGGRKASATCTGASGGAVTCTCAEGVAKGKTFSAPTCEAFFGDNIWDECNLATGG